jgi:hypothetical protein
MKAEIWKEGGKTTFPKVFFPRPAFQRGRGRFLNMAWTASRRSFPRNSGEPCYPSILHRFIPIPQFVVQYLLYTPS